MEPVSFVTGASTATAVFTGIAVALLLHLVNQETKPDFLRTFRVVFLVLAIFTGFTTVSLGLVRTAEVTVPDPVIDGVYLFVIIAVVLNLVFVLDDWHRRRRSQASGTTP